jgi:hypothetical protein
MKGMIKMLKKIKESQVYQKLITSKPLQVGTGALAIVGTSAVTAFADTPTPTQSTSVITSDMLKPLVSIITSNIGAILPVGITILGAIIGVSLIPRIVYKFL